MRLRCYLMDSLRQEAEMLQKEMFLVTLLLKGKEQWTKVVRFYERNSGGYVVVRVDRSLFGNVGEQVSGDPYAEPVVELGLNEAWKWGDLQPVPWAFQTRGIPVCN
jgi:hypothetical protein